MNEDLGTVTRNGDTWDIRFERNLSQPIEQVWAAITIPERIADWFAQAEVDLRLGGRFALRFAEQDYAFEGVITELDPPRLIVWTWPHEAHPDSVVRWELAPEGPGCRLILTQTGMVKPLLVEVAAGWHVFLEALPGAVGGPALTWTRSREEALVRVYATALAT